jgi:hypothetical protein
MELHASCFEHYIIVQNHVILHACLLLARRVVFKSILGVNGNFMTHYTKSTPFKRKHVHLTLHFDIYGKNELQNSKGKGNYISHFVTP